MTKTFNPAQLKKRYAKEKRFKYLSFAAVILTSAFVFMLLIDIFYKAIPTLTEKTVTLEIQLDKAVIMPNGGENYKAADVQTPLNESLLALFPEVKGRAERNKLLSLLSQGAGDELIEEIVKNPSIIGQKVMVKALLASNADLYLKNSLVNVTREKIATRSLVFALDSQAFIRITPSAYEIVKESQFINVGDTLVTLHSNEKNRKINDKQALWLEILNDKKLISTQFNSRFFLKSDSREPELAGIRGALTGTILTVLLTLLICLPLGVAAAIYLQEFASKNKYTDILEVNINNLAAVPSIVFGLLGLAVFLNAFHLPRSAPLVGGLVLALMVLPTIIIASRSAIAAVPPSIKQAALGVGASEQQAIFHHVLPLAMPGIMTGTIIGVARAIGETAPLLMIGMVAFIIDIPKNITDAATVLPVQIYLWSDLPEAGFVSRTATAIALLLLVLLALNLLAVILRNKYERRW
jgi:phosphate transport system permease protein